MAYFRCSNSSGGGSVEYKTHTESTFTISSGATKTITINDMQGYGFLFGVSKWTNTFPFLHSDEVGNKIYRSGAWETSPNTFLAVTVNGNIISIYNPSSAGQVTVSGLTIQYY